MCAASELGASTLPATYDTWQDFTVDTERCSSNTGTDGTVRDVGQL